MRMLLSVSLLTWLVGSSPAWAYIEVPHSLGRCVHESTNIVLVELVRVNKEKNLLIYKKVADIKGKFPDQLKHNIGQKGFHPREWQTVMAWAEVGKRAVFMCNGDASETCIGHYWYQCYREGEWWGMSHGEPFLLRTFVGDPDKLADLITRMLKGEEVIVPCYADGNKDLLHQRKGKLQRMRASLKKLDYNPKRDFVGWGGDGEEIEFKTIELLSASAKGWKFLPASMLPKDSGEAWTQAAFNDSTWRVGAAPIGYGEEEIARRKGTLIGEKGEDFVFRRWVDVPHELLTQKNASFRLSIASDDNAKVYLNGLLVDADPEDDHEFAYWNREIELPLKSLKPGLNLIAARVKNKSGSSDLYFDAELSVNIPIVKKPAKPVASGNPASPLPGTSAPSTVTRPADEPRDPHAMKVDPQTKTIEIQCVVAPRKLPNLDQVYPIEVIATWPAPRAQKAHETIVTFKGIKPSDVHQALLGLGLKPGKPALGENTQAQGPEVKIFLEVTKAGKTQRLPIEQCLMQKNGQPMIALKWHFTGSAMKQPDPEKDETVLGADLTGTLISIFPVTDSTLFQSHLTMKDEPKYRLETNKAVLPAEGEKVKLIIVVP